MTNEEFIIQKRANKISEFSSWTQDQVRALMEEVYWEGYREGFNNAVYRLQTFGPSLLESRMDAYFDSNMPKIHRRLKLIRQMMEEKGEI